MKQIIITMLLLLAATIANAQDKEKAQQDAQNGGYEVFVNPEQSPQFPGGDKACWDYIKKNIIQQLEIYSIFLKKQYRTI